jgi:hypothetical protein
MSDTTDRSIPDPHTVEAAPVPEVTQQPPHRSLIDMLPEGFDPECHYVEAGKLIPNHHYWDKTHRQVVPNGQIWDAELAKAVRPQDRPNAIKGKRRGGPGRGKINGSARSNAKRLAASQRAQTAVQLRIQGYTLPEIAQACDYNSEAAVCMAIKRVMDRRDKLLAQELIEVSMVRVERMFQAVAIAAFQGDLLAVRQAQALIEQELRIVGVVGAATA